MSPSKKSKQVQNKNEKLIQKTETKVYVSGLLRGVRLRSFFQLDHYFRSYDHLQFQNIRKIAETNFQDLNTFSQSAITIEMM